jgi:hypothetical protein
MIFKSFRFIESILTYLTLVRKFISMQAYMLDYVSPLIELFGAKGTCVWGFSPMKFEMVVKVVRLEEILVAAFYWALQFL